jgi:hypothetical protein
MKIKNKKAADENSLEQLIFIILNTLFFVTILFFVWRSASADSLMEETYAKKIGLIIDSMKPGTEVDFSLLKLNEKAKANHFNGVPVFIDVDKNLVRVTISEKTHYDYTYYSNIKLGDWSIEQNNKILVIKT